MTNTTLIRSLVAATAIAAAAACSHGGGSPAPAPAPTAAPQSTPNTPANPTNSAARRGLPNGVTAIMVAEGDSIFHAKTCKNCHGADAKGAANGPNLTTGKFLQVDGSFDGFVRLITTGVPADQIKDPAHKVPMGARGGRGTPLTDDQIKSLAAYIYALNHP